MVRGVGFLFLVRHYRRVRDGESRLGSRYEGQFIPQCQVLYVYVDPQRRDGAHLSGPSNGNVKGLLIERACCQQTADGLEKLLEAPRPYIGPSFIIRLNAYKSVYSPDLCGISYRTLPTPCDSSGSAICDDARRKTRSNSIVSGPFISMQISRR
jgi:hypothetical protein